ncbi:hypothetical protein [Variovorax paradoxus]|uniref:hypothetical protein n=1 Tax=Variovorax paradoxus TaxID=34073 RepID=UPI0012BBBC23|nr:hypothetical protein [Variovorax paradoxus]
MTIPLPAAYRAFIDTNGLFEGFAVLSGEEHYLIGGDQRHVGTPEDQRFSVVDVRYLLA